MSKHSYNKRRQVYFYTYTGDRQKNNGDKITVIGRATNDTEINYSELSGIRCAVIVTDDDMVYPVDYPKEEALKEKAIVIKMLKMAKAAMETYEPTDPF